MYNFTKSKISLEFFEVFVEKYNSLNIHMIMFREDYLVNVRLLSRDFYKASSNFGLYMTAVAILSSQC